MNEPLTAEQVHAATLPLHVGVGYQAPAQPIALPQEDTRNFRDELVKLLHRGEVYDPNSGEYLTGK